MTQNHVCKDCGAPRETVDNDGMLTIKPCQECKASSRSRIEENEWLEGVALAEVFTLQEKINVLECAMRHRNLGYRVQKLKLDLDMQLEVWREVLKTTEFAHKV